MEERTLLSPSGFHFCWSARREGNSTTGRTGHGLDSHSSSSLISSPAHSIGALSGRSQDQQALALALQGLENDHYAALETPWEKTFFFLPVGHSEELMHLERAVTLAEELVAQAPPELRKVLEHSAAQARGHRDVIARFGRHPHRNAVLGRHSTPEELDYLASGQLVHTRPLPS